MGLISQLSEFMQEYEGYQFRRWLRDDIAEIFVRRGFHVVKRERKVCLDIANINILLEHRGMGVFTTFLTQAEEFVDADRDWDGIYIENVLPQRLQEFFRKRKGYEEVEVSSQIMELATFFRPKRG